MMINKLEQNNNAVMPFITLWFYTAILIFATACSQNKKQKPAAEVGQKEQIAPSTTLLASLPENARPKVILLDTVPKPSVKNITNRGKSFQQPSETIAQEN